MGSLRKKNQFKMKECRGDELIKVLEDMLGGLDKMTLKKNDFEGIDKSLLGTKMINGKRFNKSFIKFRLYLNSETRLRDFSFFNYEIYTDYENKTIEFRTIKGSENNWQEVSMDSNVEIWYDYRVGCIVLNFIEDRPREKFRLVVLTSNNGNRVHKQCINYLQKFDKVNIYNPPEEEHDFILFVETKGDEKFDFGNEELLDYIYNGREMLYTGDYEEGKLKEVDCNRYHVKFNDITYDVIDKWYAESMGYKNECTNIIM